MAMEPLWNRYFRWEDGFLRRLAPLGKKQRTLEQKALDTLTANIGDRDSILFGLFACSSAHTVPSPQKVLEDATEMTSAELPRLTSLVRQLRKAAGDIRQLRGNNSVAALVDFQNLLQLSQPLERILEDAAEYLEASVAPVKHTIMRRYSLQLMWLAMLSAYIKCKTDKPSYHQLATLLEPAFEANGTRKPTYDAGTLRREITRLRSYLGGYTIDLAARATFPIHIPH